ncbi:MAG: phosphoribosylaminoimidazolesuccinocarboxamide synthase [Thermoproteota archaeon]
MGSVKDLEVLEEPSEHRMGVGRFHFSDRYSVFDWGEMPDHIPNKGMALCLMGAYCFHRLEAKGVNTHYRGLVTEEGEVVSFQDLDQPTDIMEFDLVNVYHPKTRMEDGSLTYDYTMFNPDLNNYLIPLEVIYRNGLPPGSSVFKRLEEGTVTLEELGLDHHPEPGEDLSSPIFDVSTKLEEKDRYITWEEGQKIAGLTPQEVEDIQDILLKVDETITDLAFQAGLKNEDGKIELAFNPSRELMIVDVVGTLDECRFTYKDLPVSKEAARRFYRETAWYQDVLQTKKKAKKEGIQNWRRLCPTSPSSLDPELKTIITEMYLSAANELTNRNLFDAPTLKETTQKYQEYTASN